MRVFYYINKHTNMLNMLKALVVALLITTQLRAQDSTKVLIADETTLTYLKASAKIETDNDRVFKAITAKWEGSLKSYTVSTKKDRHGPYKHYTMYATKENAALIRQWAVKNL